MTEIIRTKTKAAGPLTPEELEACRAIADEWIEVALRTDPIVFDDIAPAIEQLYEVAGFAKPAVLIAPSPLVAALAFGAASAKDNTPQTARAAIEAITPSDADADPNKAAIAACRDFAGAKGIKAARQWNQVMSGGNAWSGFTSYICAARDVLGLDLPEHRAFKPYELATRHGSFRILQPDYCIVSDFPERIMRDENAQAHCENGPSHKWRDGTRFHHWHGVRVPGHWVESPETTDPNEVIRTENVEARAAGCAILGWARMAPQLNQKILDGDPNSDIGALVELSLDGLPEPGRFLMAQCPRNGTICEGVPRVSDIDNKPIETAIAAQAWRDCLPQSEYTHAAIRT